MDHRHGSRAEAQATSALLYDFATQADYRVAVKREFDGIKTFFAEYQQPLRKTYKAPKIADPQQRLERADSRGPARSETVLPPVHREPSGPRFSVFTSGEDAKEG